MAKKYVAGATSDIAEGGSKLVTLAGRDIGIYNVAGSFYAFADRCPHAGGSLCEGFITGIAVSGGPNDYRLERKGEFLRCPWHGWEFDIRTGQSWCDPNSMRARKFSVKVEAGADLAKGPYVAETFEVKVEGEYLVIEL